jgi:hypothetical protein
LRWQKGRRGVAANFTKRVLSGGGLVGAVHALRFDVSGQLQLSRLTAIQGAFAYSNNVLLDWTALNSGSPGQEFLASASIERQLQRHLFLRIGYGRQQQHYGWVSTAAGMITQNRTWLSLTYDSGRGSSSTDIERDTTDAGLLAAMH